VDLDEISKLRQTANELDPLMEYMSKIKVCQYTQEKCDW